MEEDHLIIREDLRQLEEYFTEAELRYEAFEAKLASVSAMLQEAQDEASTQLLKAEEFAAKQKTTKTKAVEAKKKLRHFKKKFHQYKAKARSYFRQLSFATWIQDRAWA